MLEQTGNFQPICGEDGGRPKTTVIHRPLARVHISIPSLFQGVNVRPCLLRQYSVTRLFKSDRWWVTTPAETLILSTSWKQTWLLLFLVLMLSSFSRLNSSALFFVSHPSFPTITFGSTPGGGRRTHSESVKMKPRIARYRN